jgi:uroporphyrinogen decarboxylase
MLDNPKPDRMTPMERLDALMAGDPIDRIPFFPFALGFCAQNVGYSLAEFYNDPEKCFWSQVWTQEQYGYDGFPQYRYANFGAWEFGAEIDFPRGEYDMAPKVTRFAVNSEQDVEDLEVPEVKTAGAIPLYMQFSKLQERYGLPITIPCGSPISRASNICGVDLFCRWIIKEPELVHRLARLATDFILQVVQHWIDAFGTDRLVAADGTHMEANNLLSPNQVEEFAFPYLNEVHEKVLSMGVEHFYTHFCGDQNLNLPLFSQVPMGNPGIASISPEVDLTTAIKFFGDNCVIAGNIEPQILQTGTPQEVFALCKEAILEAKYDAPRGYMLMAGCDVPIHAPPYNFYMMKKAINDFGWYDK